MRGEDDVAMHYVVHSQTTPYIDVYTQGGQRKLLLDGLVDTVMRDCGGALERVVRER